MTDIRLMTGRLFVSMFAATALVGVLPTAFADVLVPVVPGNQLSVAVQPQVTKDPNTQIYTYSYTISNNSGSLQEMWLFAVELAPGTEVLGSTSPSGWQFGVHEDQPIASWAAVEVGELPADFIDDGNVVPSPFNLKPGETKSGFSFRTFVGPADGAFYAQGFKKLAQVSGDVEELRDVGFVEPPLSEDSYRGSTTTPNPLPYSGGRRPAVDGFLVFMNVQKDGTVFSAPATIIVKFSAAGESVDRSTFRATLNQRDVTSLFVPDTTLGGDLVARFDFQNSSLAHGRNVLLTSVDGTVPDTTRSATDVDRVSFEVQN
jgi:hypothetical protein